MKITIENTSQIVTLPNGVEGRVWDGVTESGVKVHCLITRVAVHKDDDASLFERELIEKPPKAPSRPEAFPLRLIL